MIVYLACPYTDDDPKVREDRFRLANRAAGKLIESGVTVFSPISHSHPIATEWGLQGDFGMWEVHNAKWLDKCEVMYVLKLDGWEKSKGVQQEITWAETLKMPVVYLEPEFAGASNAI